MTSPSLCPRTIGVCQERSVLKGRPEVEMASIALVIVESGSDWPPFVRGAAHDVVL
jgi:hypothetical protein